MSSRFNQLVKKAEQELPTFNPKEEQKQLFNAAFKILTQAGDEYESRQIDAALVHFLQFSTIITQLKRSNAKKLFPTETTKSEKLFPLVLKKIEEIKNAIILEEQEKAKNTQVEDAFEERLKQFQQTKPVKAVERTDSDDFMMSLSDSDSDTDSSARPAYLLSDSDHSDSTSTIDGIPTEIISVMENERVETENALPVSASLRSLTFITQWDEEIKQQELKNEEIRKQEENRRLLAEQANSFIIHNEGLTNPPSSTELDKPPVLTRVADSLKKIFSKSTTTSEPVTATLVQPASTVTAATLEPSSNNVPPKKKNTDERNYSLNSPIMPNITTLRDSMAYPSPTIVYSTPSFHGGDISQTSYQRNNNTYNNNSNYGSDYGSDLGTTVAPPVQMIPPHQCASFAVQPSGEMLLVGMDGSVMSLPPGVSLIPDHQVSSHTQVLSPDADGTYVLFDGTKLIPISETVTF